MYRHLKTPHLIILIGFLYLTFIAVFCFKLFVHLKILITRIKWIIQNVHFAMLCLPKWYSKLRGKYIKKRISFN